MGLVLGLDISTTATKAILVDGDGAVGGIAQSAYGLSTPHPLWSEQDPGDWWTGAVAAIRTVLAEAGRRADEVEAIGLTGQMHGAVLLDASDAVLRPAILWNDQRTAVECDTIREAVGAQRLIEITGNDALTGFTAPKLLWVREHEPDVWSRIAHVLLPKDYVRLRLTGEHAIDKADAAGTLLLDLAARDWSPVVLEALGIPASWLPRTFEGPEVTGRLTDAAAAETGLRAGTPVVAGGGDQSANGVGVGAVAPGTTALSLGTSGVIFASTDRPLFDPGVEMDGPCDRDRLALTTGQVPHRRGEAGEVGVEAAHHLAGGILHCPVVHGPPPGHHLAPEEHVGGRVDVVGQRQRLVDAFDVQGLGVARVGDGYRLALDQDLPGVRAMRAGQGADEGRLPRTVSAPTRPMTSPS